MPERKTNHWHSPDRMKRCICCCEEKPLSAFYAYQYTMCSGVRSTRYESRCKLCARKRRKQQSAQNPDYNSEMSKQWRRRNPQRSKAAAADYRRSQHGKRVKAKCQRVRKARLRAGSNHKDPRIQELYQSALDWEQKLLACVATDDRFDLKVHVDHIVPLASGGEHVFENLQLLDARLNLQKGVKPHSALTRHCDA